jgi:hypothetical protein
MSDFMYACMPAAFAGSAASSSPIRRRSRIPIAIDMFISSRASVSGMLAFFRLQVHESPLTLGSLLVPIQPTRA